MHSQDTSRTRQWTIFPGEADSNEIVLFLDNGTLPQSLIQNWIIGTEREGSSPWIVIAKSEESFEQILQYYEYRSDLDHSADKHFDRGKLESEIPLDTHELTAVMVGSNDLYEFVVIEKDFPSNFVHSTFPNHQAEIKNRDLGFIRWYNSMVDDGLKLGIETEWELEFENDFGVVTLGLDDMYTTEDWEHRINANVMRVTLRPRDAWTAPPEMIQGVANVISFGRRVAFLKSRNQSGWYY